MATSKKQLEANKRNALSSTGPRSPEGKDKSRRNAFKHGLTAETMIIKDEDAEELNSLAERIFDELGPGSQLESEIATRIATIMWRIRRVPQIEAGLLLITEAESQLEVSRMAESGFETLGLSILKLDEERHKFQSRSSDDGAIRAAVRVFDLPQARLAEAFRRGAKKPDTLGKLSRYEGALMRQLERSLELLHKLKMERTNSVKDITDKSETAGA